MYISIFELLLYILSVYSLSVCSFLYIFIYLPEMVNKNEYNV